MKLQTNSLMAPIHSGAHSALALGKIGPACTERVEPLVEAMQERSRRQQPGAGGRKLDRKWQPVETTAELDYGRAVVMAEREACGHALGTLDEQLHRRLFLEKGKGEIRIWEG
jgi:hypothetical protein